MLSSASQAAVDQLRGVGEPLLEFVANALQDALAAQNAEFVGQLKLIADYSKMNPGTQPPEYPNLSHDLPSVLTIVHETGFQKPDDTGPNGGTALVVRGPCQFVPNRDGDVTIDSPSGTIKVKKFYLNGVEIPSPSASGSYVLIVEDGVFSWEELEDC